VCEINFFLRRQCITLLVIYKQEKVNMHFDQGVITFFNNFSFFEIYLENRFKKLKSLIIEIFISQLGSSSAHPLSEQISCTCTRNKQLSLIADLIILMPSTSTNEMKQK
jgi:hypothetical protein